MPGMEGTEGAWCRGSFVLGTACGHCQKCSDEALRLVPDLIKAVRDLQNKLTVVHMVIPGQPPDPKWDYSDEFKVRCFDEARRILSRT